MSSATLGLVTIGQSPRPDICETYASVIGTGIQITEAGALDGLTARDIQALAPEQGDIPLVTLAHGAEVRVGKAAITPLLQRAIARVVEEGASVVVVLCTGHFEGLTAPVPLIEPDRVLDGFLRAIRPTGRLGVVMPDAGQEGMMRQKWHGYDLNLETASPYQPPTAWAALIDRFVAAGVEAIVLDCMGFGPDAKAFFAARASPGALRPDRDRTSDSRHALAAVTHSVLTAVRSRMSDAGAQFRPPTGNHPVS